MYIIHVEFFKKLQQQDIYFRNFIDVILHEKFYKTHYVS